MSHNHKIWNEMARFFANEMNESEKAQFLERIESEHSVNTQFEEMKSTWINFDNDPSLKYKDTEGAWNKLKEQLDQNGLLDQPGKKNSTFHLRPFVRIAATILLVVGLGIPAVYFSIFNNGENATTLSHSSSEGVRTVDLPDGSRVFMNKGAEISYPKEFKEDRILKLRGEAFFEVMSDPDKPFRVNSGKIMVSVLGTSFNIKQDDNKPHVEIFVKSGKVQVSGGSASEILTLQPGDIAFADGITTKRGNLENLNYLSWKTKDFVFIDEPLSAILNTLEIAYHVEIETEGEELEDMRLTSTYMQQSIDAILETISAAFSLELEKKGDTYYLN